MRVTQEIIDKLMETAGIKSYDGMSQCLVSTNLDVIPSTVPVKDKYRDRVYGRFVTGTENSKFFRDETMDSLREAMCRWTVGMWRSSVRLWPRKWPENRGQHHLNRGWR